MRLEESLICSFDFSCRPQTAVFMVAHQLDLFGGPLKPPKKIKVDDEIPVEDAKTLVEEDEKDATGDPIDGDSRPIFSEQTIAEEEATTDFEKEVDIPEIETQNAFDETLNVGGDFANIDQPDFVEDFHSEERSDEFLEEAVAEEDIPVLINQPASVDALPGDAVSESFSGEATSIHVERPLAEEEMIAPPRNEPTGEEVGEFAVEEAQNESNEEELLNEVEVAVIEEEVTEQEAFGPGSEAGNEDILAGSEPPTESADEALDEIGQQTGEDDPGTATTVQDRRKKSSQEYEFTDAKLNVPPDEELFKRQYYNMRETAAMFGVNQSLLRFWENEFTILHPKKNKKGDRYFRPVDVKNLVLIYHLLRVRKFTLEGAKDYLHANRNAGDRFELVSRLEKLKSFLLELKATF